MDLNKLKSSSYIIIIIAFLELFNIFLSYTPSVGAEICSSNLKNFKNHVSYPEKKVTNLAYAQQILGSIADNSLGLSFISNDGQIAMEQIDSAVWNATTSKMNLNYAEAEKTDVVGQRNNYISNRYLIEITIFKCFVLVNGMLPTEEMFNKAIKQDVDSLSLIKSINNTSGANQIKMAKKFGRSLARVLSLHATAIKSFVKATEKLKNTAPKVTTALLSKYEVDREYTEALNYFQNHFLHADPRLFLPVQKILTEAGSATTLVDNSVFKAINDFDGKAILSAKLSAQALNTGSSIINSAANSATQIINMNSDSKAKEAFRISMEDINQAEKYINEAISEAKLSSEDTFSVSEQTRLANDTSISIQMNIKSIKIVLQPSP